MRSLQGAQGKARLTRMNPPPPGLKVQVWRQKNKKADILSSLREAISQVIREELKGAIAEDFNAKELEHEHKQSTSAKKFKRNS